MELHERPILSITIIEEIPREPVVENIWAVDDLTQAGNFKEGRERRIRRERDKVQKNKTLRRQKIASVQDELDRQTQEVVVGPGSSTPNDISSMSSNTALPPEPPVSAQVTIGATIVEDVLKAIGSTTDESRARSKGPLADDG